MKKVLRNVAEIAFWVILTVVGAAVLDLAAAFMMGV